jgi:hypothetical protein
VDRKIPAADANQRSLRDAWEALLDRLRATRVKAVTRWSRDELYDDVVGLNK